MTSSPDTVPTYAELASRFATLQEQHASHRRRFNECASLDDLEALLAKVDATVLRAAPWLQWIASGPHTEKKGMFDPNLHWAAKPSNGDELDINRKKQQRLVALLRRLLERGADPTVYETHGYRDRDGLAALAHLPELSFEQRAELIGMAVERGGDVTRRVWSPVFAGENGPFTGWYVAASALDLAVRQADEVGDDRSTVLLDALAPRASTGALEDAWAQRAMWFIYSQRTATPERLQELDALLARCGDLNRPHPRLEETDRGTLLHFACQQDAVSLEMVQRLVDHCDVNAPLPGPGFAVSVGIVRGSAPRLSFEAGATALDLVQGVLDRIAAIEAAQVKLDADATAKLRASMTARRDLLLARGAVSKRPYRQVLPPPLAEVATELSRVLRFLGEDDAALRSALAAVDTSRVGAWNLLGEVMPRLAKKVLRPALAKAPLLAHTLGAFVGAKAVDAEAAHWAANTWQKKLPVSKLPKKGREGVEAAWCFHQDGDVRYAVVRRGSAAEIWKLEGDGAERIAEGVAPFLRGLIDAATGTSAASPSPAKVVEAIAAPLRPFDSAAKAFRKDMKGVVEHDEAKGPFNRAGRALAAGDLGEWATHAPTPALYLVKDAPLEDPASFFERANFGNAMGTWNCKGRASWHALSGGGFVASVHLTHEQHEEDVTRVLVGAWRVSEGVAVALMRNDAHDVLAKMVGLGTWPTTGDRTVSVWYGE